MTQKYGDDKVIAPGTVIISAGAEVSDIKKIVSPVVAPRQEYIHLLYRLLFRYLEVGWFRFRSSFEQAG